MFRIPISRSQPEPGPLSEPVLTDIVRRVVEVTRPQRIVMFGSAARGTTRADSDVDLLVVKSGRFQRGPLVDGIYRTNCRVGHAAVEFSDLALRCPAQSADQLNDQEFHRV